MRQRADPDDVWKRLHDEASSADPRYFGYAGARTRFLKFVPDGFAAPGFAGKERDYKLRAKAKLDTEAPVGRALRESGFGETALAAFRTNLLAPFEKMRVRDLLRGSSADAFIQAAANFTLDTTETALRRVETILKPHDCAKWTIVSYLPFLWRPETHMYLKPEVTNDFAARVGHSFSRLYEPRLDPAVYRSLLDMADRTAAEVVDLAPKGPYRHPELHLGRRRLTRGLGRRSVVKQSEPAARHRLELPGIASKREAHTRSDQG